MRTRVLLPIAAVVAVVAVAVAVFAILTFDEPEVVDFGERPPQGGASLPGDVGLDVTDVEPSGPVPPPDVVFAEADWSQVAGWIARENAEGRPVLVNLWASWCEPCEREIPMLNEAAADHPDIAFLGVATNDALEDARAAVDRFGIAFPALRDAEFDQVAFQVGARAMPTTVVFDTDGTMVGRVVGEVNARSLADLLDTVR